MPWKETTSMSLKHEFVNLAERGCFSLLCRRFGISRKTGYSGAIATGKKETTASTIDRGDLSPRPGRLSPGRKGPS